MKSVVTNSFRMNLTVMRIFGLYPPEKPSALYRVFGYFAFFIFMFPVPVLGTVFLLLDENGLTQLGDNAFLIAEITCQFTKLFPFIHNAAKIRRCIKYFEAPSFSVRTNQQETINSCTRICQRNSRVYLIGVVGITIMWTSKPFFGEEYKLPTDIWLPFNALDDLRIYASVFAFLVVAVAYASISCSAIDPLIAGLAGWAACQLEVLKDNLQFLSEYAEEEVEENNNNFSKSEIIRNKIRQCIDHHNAILEFVEEYQECFSIGVFGQFAGGVFVICFCCLKVSKMEPLSFDFISIITYLCVYLAEIYFYCYYGTVLFEESNTLTGAVYMGRWYELDMASRKALITLMERSQRPIIVTAGKILELSLVTFTTILRRAYSLLALLKNFY